MAASEGGGTTRTMAQRHLAVQYAVGRVLLAAADLDQAAPRLLQAIGSGLGWSWGALWSVDPAADALTCRATWHAPGVRAPEFEAASRATRFPPGAGLPGRVWASGEPIWVRDVQHDGNVGRRPPAAQAGLHAAFAFPIRSERGVLGVVEFFHRAIRRPDEPLLRAMATLGGQLGQFVERARAEQALRDSEARKGATLEAALDAIVTIDHEGRIVEFNPAAERTFGYARAEAVGQELAELVIPPALRERHRRGLAHYLATGEGPILDRRLELTALRADGAEFPVELTITRLPTAGPPLFTGFLRDLTERRRAEELTRASERRFRTLVEQSPVSTQVFAPDGTTLLVNRAWEQLWGVTLEQLGGYNILRDPQLVERGIMPYIERAFAGEPAAIPPVRYEPERTIAGRSPVPYRWVRAVIYPVKDEGGRVREVVLQHEDITELRAAEEERERVLARERAARAAAERVQAITDAALAHLTLDRLLDELLGRIRALLAVDTAAILLLEPGGADLVPRATVGLEGEVERGVRIPVGRGFAGRVAAERRPLVVAEVDPAEVVSPVMREKGVRSLLGAPLVVEGRVIGVVHVGTLAPHRFDEEEARLLQLVADRAALAIEHARLYEAERRARAEAEAAVRLRDRFLSIAAHELKTPVTTIMARVQLLLRQRARGRLDEDRLARSLDVIDDVVAQLDRLTRDLLDVSRLQMGQLPLRPGPVDLAALVRDVATRVQDQLEPRHRLRLELGSDPCPVVADADRLGQVLANLLENAAKYSPEGGELRVTLQMDDGGALLGVHDEGMGLPPGSAEAIFAPFGRAANAERRQIRGLGLGLYLCRDIVARHGGRIRAESAGEDRGTTIWVWLPTESAGTAGGHAQE